MRAEYYRERWQTMAAAPDAAALSALAIRVADSFVDRYFYSDDYNADYVELLCEMATACDDPELNQIAARALFGIIIERLCDDFEELQTETYNRLMSQIATFLRGLPEGAELDARLNDFGLPTEHGLFTRVESMRLEPDRAIDADLAPCKVIVLSRVTIGADVAITSIICQRALTRFPHAEVVVIGNHKLRQIFATHPSIRVRELGYTRRGGLLERFSAWLDLLATVRDEVGDLNDEEYLVLDPDSRLTQLGVLPLVEDSAYRFFNSRSKADYPVTASISELTNLWLDEVLQTSDFCYPAIWLPEEETLAAERLLGQVLSDARHIIAVNLGVGGNPRKRLDSEFEIRLVESLLQDENNLVILDLGFGEEERRQTGAILEAIQASGVACSGGKFDEAGVLNGESRLVGLECSVAEIAAIIANAEEFIGYDSACQHIAAALGVKTFTVFAGTNNPRFVRRWHACGPATSEILYVDTITAGKHIDVTELVGRLNDLRLA